MERNKWFWFFLWLLGGLWMAGQAAHYFIGGATYKSSSLRDVLVIAQFIAGTAIAFYGWKKYRMLNRTREL